MKLTADRRISLIDGVRSGLTKVLCARRAGIAESTLHLWLATGRNHRESKRIPWPFVLDPGGTTGRWKPREHPKWSRELELLEAFERGESNRLVEGLLKVRDAYKGGQVVERTTTTRTLRDGTTETTVREKFSQPDWKAAAWMVTNTAKDQFGTRVELTGEDGGPVAMTFADLVSAAADEERAREKEAQKGKGGPK